MIKEIKKIIKKYFKERKIPADSYEQNILLIVHSLGRDGLSANALQILNFPDIKEINSLLENQHRSQFDINRIFYQRLKTVEEIMNDMMTFIESYEATYVENLFYSDSFRCFLLDGLHVLVQIDALNTRIEELDFIDYYNEELELAGLSCEEVWDRIE